MVAQKHVNLGSSISREPSVDSDHAGDKLTRRSSTGFVIFLNMAPIIWFSKKQTTIKTSVFGTEFVAMKQGMEMLRGLRYKLRMMGVEVPNPSYIYGDNMSVIHNTQRPKSTLKKKSNSVCYTESPFEMPLETVCNVLSLAHSLDA